MNKENDIVNLLKKELNNSNKTIEILNKQLCELSNNSYDIKYIVFMFLSFYY